MKTSLFKIAALTVALASASAQAAAPNTARLNRAVTMMEGLNAIVTGNMSASSDVEGKLFVGGNLSGTANIGNGNSTFDAISSTYQTVTVGGSVTGILNVNNGANGASGKVATGAYGAIVGGTSSGTINLNDQNSAATVVFKGNAGQISVGAGSNVNIGGNVTSTLSLGQGSTARIGGNIVGLNAAVSGVTVYVGGSVDNNGNAPNFNLGTGSNAYVTGQFKSQNLNGLGGGTVYTKGQRYSGGCASATGYNFCQTNITVQAPDYSAAANISSQVTDMQNSLTYLSAGLATLTPNATITAPTAIPLASFGSGAYSVLNITNGASFFNQTLDGADLLKNMGTKTVIINVGGTTITQGNTFNFNSSSSVTASHIIWNFYEATSVTLNSFYGSVLAPNATLTNTNAINGSVVAKIFNQQGEVHLGTFDGNTSFVQAITLADPNPTALPETASWAMMIMGFGAIGAMARRRRGVLAVA